MSGLSRGDLQSRMDFLSSSGYRAGWLCSFCLLCILSTHLCVFLCLFLPFPVPALSACFWTIFCLLFAKFHSFSWGCSETGSGPQIYTIQFIMDAKNTFSSRHFEDVYFNLLKMCLGQILHVYTNLTAKWVVPHHFFLLRIGSCTDLQISPLLKSSYQLGFILNLSTYKLLIMIVWASQRQVVR